MLLLPTLALAVMASADPPMVFMNARVYTVNGNALVRFEHYDYVGQDDGCDSYTGLQTSLDQVIAKLVEGKTATLVGSPSVTIGMGAKATLEVKDSLKQDVLELTPRPEDPVDTIHPHVKVEVTWHLKAGKDVEVEKTANSRVMLGADRELVLVAPFNGSRMLLVLTAKPK